ncbi:hypothetical protein SAMN05216268_126100 [Streptomyces yunnanensis]|uniref:Uncharacterized protein n=1 Tax=Streptomyces yunnanensis TaxID=156453 RepID=A0A9X8N7U6_9ACTN|nr:hypothetical protein SAMN05216268_126100 [Streptomyces yunnanensis]
MKKIDDLKAGDHIRVAGHDTRGWDVTREGYLVAEPKRVKTQWNLKKVDAVRLHVDQDPAAGPTRQNFVTILPDTEVEELGA